MKRIFIAALVAMPFSAFAQVGAVDVPTCQAHSHRFVVTLKRGGTAGGITYDDEYADACVALVKELEAQRKAARTAADFEALRQRLEAK